jgi:putative cell wall-binding protein
MQPYYTGVSDPFCASPTYDPWTPVSLSGLTVAAKLAPRISGEPAGAGKTVWVTGMGLDRAHSGFVRRADVYWSNGASTKGVAGDTVRGALGLPSTKFWVGGPFTRIALGDRYATAAAISRSSFPTAGAAAVAVVVNGTDEKFADALTASALGGTANGPVLLTTASGLNSASKYELARLKPAKVYVIGGTASVPEAVLAAVRSASGTTNVVRLGGRDRYSTAALVAREIATMSPTPTKVMIASGEKWPDSAIAAVAAAMSKRPLLLVSGTALPKATADTLKALSAKETAVFGGEATIPGAVIGQICAITGEKAPTKRFGVGTNRYAEAVSAADWSIATFGASPSTVYIASGEVFPDSVTGGVLAARNRHPLVLTSGAAPAYATSSWLSANKSSIVTVTVLGGTGSVSDDCASKLGTAAY